MIDEKNILRVDLHLIYQSVKRQAQYAVRALYSKDQSFHPDDYAISENEYEQLHEFAMDAASTIANDTHRVKYMEQTGIDGLTYYQDLENPTEAVSYNDDIEGEETIDTPDGTEILVGDISGKRFTKGEKLVAENQDTIEFVIFDDFDTARATPITKTHERFTYVQTFITTAMTNYILMKWWMLCNIPQLAQSNQAQYNEAVSRIRMNITSRNNAKNVERPQLPFYGF
jgi:hypothetical protein